jgi:hypothetical protein
MNPRDYDAWRLSPPEERPEVGTEEGDTCNRRPKPDEDAPRGYKPKPCQGVLVLCQADGLYCDQCGEVA